MHRRSVLVCLASVAGCAGRPTRPETDDEGTTTTDRTPTGEGTTTTGKPSTANCRSVETEFAIPEPSKPSTMAALTVREPVIRVEEAYEESIGVTAAMLPGVPGSASLSQFNLYDDHTSVESLDRGFRVTVGGMARYTTGGSGNETEAHWDRPVEVATYLVSEERIRRESGIGNLTGTLVCW